MGAELKYIFTFGQQHINPETGESMKDYWVEVIMHDDYLKLSSMDVSILKEKARKVMMSRYGKKWSMQYDENQFNGNYFPKGCYQTLYYPLPDEIEIKVENKFAVGDMVRPKSGNTGNLKSYFNGEPKNVVRIDELPGYDYAGGQIVYIMWDSNGVAMKKEVGIYANALEKV